MRLAVLWLALLAAPAALAQTTQIAVSALRGTPVTTPAGAALGTITGVLLDVRARGVHYVLVEGKGTYPLNALRPGPTPALLLDERAQQAMPADAHYVRAVELLGTPAHDALGNRVGRVKDVVISLRTGATERLIVDFDDGASLALPAHAVRLRSGGVVIDADSSRRS